MIFLEKISRKSEFQLSTFQRVKSLINKSLLAPLLLQSVYARNRIKSKVITLLCNTGMMIINKTTALGGSFTG
jgi:hypothetical protein